MLTTFDPRPPQGGLRVAKRGKTTMTSTGRSKAVLRAGELASFSSAMLLLAESLPPRVTLAQMTFFLMAATSDIRGAPVTYSDIRGAMGDLAKSIKTTYAIFLAPTEQFPAGLGWLEQEIDVHDRKRRILHLTPKGMSVITGILNALE